LKPSTIAIDGPAASGKSTVGQLLARRLGYLYFDTGVMYRAATWAGLARGISIQDEAAMTEMAEQLRIDVRPPTVDDGRQYTVLADGVDITWDIRTPEIDENVSTVSAYPGVRRAMVVQQRRAAAQEPVVMVGRDIGTVVLPDADLKLYLDADVEERARRRWREVQARGQEADFEPVLASMRRRDEIDSHRDISPLRVAEDARILDTTGLDIEEVLTAAEHIIEACGCLEV
jgi:cytidylate kinase